MPNPVRIYVLHHPDSKVDPITKLEKGLGELLTNRIYDWFRLPSLEGIPVYLRSLPVQGEDWPEMPYREPGDQCVEYIVPLVDAHMVRDPRWHGYLAEVARRCAESEKEKAEEWGMKMFPVALDNTAFNLPDGIARMNFIRHGTGAPPIVVTPGAWDEKAQARAKAERAENEISETMKHLTEALARDLNARLFPEQKGERFKIFISYARADSTEQAKALRNYIQSKTQCLAFFDENDIGFGSAFDDEIEKNVGGHSKALIVLNSDCYAERPWCRLEIDRFTESRQVPLGEGSAESVRRIHVFHPLLVVDNLAGPKMTRVVPELAQAPIVRWVDGRERACFSTLMREVILGLRDVLEARTMDWSKAPATAVIVNRLPGPMALARVLRDDASAKRENTSPTAYSPAEDLPPPGTAATKEKIITVHHPGHGLPLTEMRLLERTFPAVRFQAFRDITCNLPRVMEQALAQLDGRPHDEAPLHEQVIALSTAYAADDLARIGYLPQHQDEALLHLLRPLVRLGADLLYGGTPPKRPGADDGPNAAQVSSNRNITLTLMDLMSAERRVVDIDPAGKANAPQRALMRKPLLFNISSWPACNRITEADEASWINACRVQRVTPADAKLPPWTAPVPGEFDPPPPHFRRHLALTFSRMREMLAEGFECRVPGNLKRIVRPAAFVFIGGAKEKFKGVMPGVLEEFLRAAQARPRIPIYLVGGLGGATGMIAQALLHPAKKPPPGLNQRHYMIAAASNHEEYNALVSELNAGERARVRRQFADLWNLIKAHHRQNGLHDLFSNGLTHAENQALLKTTNTNDAVSLIWTGMSHVYLGEKLPPESMSKPKPERKPKRTTTPAKQKRPARG